MVTRKKDAPDDDDAQERKERVIHTRVPERLETELRERAEGLGISVSNLVRNVLGHAFGLVGDVAADAHAIARAARGEARAAAPPPPADPNDVLGWQPIVLNKNAICTKCNDILPKGRDAGLGIPGNVIVCVKCLEEVRQ